MRSQHSSPSRRSLGRAALMVAVLLLLLPAVLIGQEVERHDPHLAVPGFDLPGLDGKRHKLEDYRGGPVFISLWATWCAPCRYELPEFQRARDAFKESHPEASFLTVNVGDSGARARTWMEREGLDLPVLLASQKFMGKYQIFVIPTILVFDTDGKLAATHHGWDQGIDLVKGLQEDLVALAVAAGKTQGESD